MTLLGVVDNLINRVESLSNTDAPGPGSESLDERASSGNSKMDEMSSDLAELENLEYTLKGSVGAVENDVKKVIDRWNDSIVRHPFLLAFVLGKSRGEENTDWDRVRINQPFLSFTIKWPTCNNVSHGHNPYLLLPRTPLIGQR
jgi:hypothetical protein